MTKKLVGKIHVCRHFLFLKQAIVSLCSFFVSTGNEKRGMPCLLDKGIPRRVWMERKRAEAASSLSLSCVLNRPQ